MLDAELDECRKQLPFRRVDGGSKLACKRRQPQFAKVAPGGSGSTDPAPMVGSEGSSPYNNSISPGLEPKRVAR